MFEKLIIKYNGIILFTIGNILIVLALILGLYSKIELSKERVFSKIEYLMSQNDEEVYNEIEINTSYIEEEIDEENSDNDENEENNDVSNNQVDEEDKKEYIGYLIIPKISLNYGFVDVDSVYNDVDKNIEILKVSDFPDVLNGNFIIAGHSGNSKISYFKNLYRLNISDIVKVKYNGKIYSYVIKNIYKEERDGTIVIRRDINKSTLTLITCSYKDKKHQTIYIAELLNVD